MTFIRRYPDRAALGLLFALWLLFFWRIYTPSEVDAVSLREGDFSAQFVSWTSYAAERWSAGELPLWNPYMNAGAPFLADPQTAVMYPPRQLTLTILAVGDDFSGARVFGALQIEMTLHVLLGLILMYTFLRVLTNTYDCWSSVLASGMGAVVFGFGGYLSAYPQLQLPVLETAVWFPAVLLGVHVATQDTVLRWHWLVGAGIVLAMAVLAGHPQTFVLMGYTSVAYLIYRMRGENWRRVLLAVTVLGIITAGLSAVQLLPTLEFQRETYRQGFSVDDKSAGFAMQDIFQAIFPRMLGDWSPLYIGVISLVLIGVSIGRHLGTMAFWVGAAILGLILSFGSKFALYQILYVLLPGFSLFRGQERNVVVVVVAASVLTAWGMASIGQEVFTQRERRHVSIAMIGLLLVTGGFALVFFFLRLMPPDGELYQVPLQASIYAMLMAGISWLVLYYANQNSASRPLFLGVVGALLIFDLFSVNLNNPNFIAIPASERLPEPAYIDVMQANLWPGQRVEGLRGIRDSYGALYRVPDIWGDSPLRLDSVEYYLWQIPIEQRWELLSVQVVNSEWESLPRTYQAVGIGQDLEGDFTIYQLTDPRPFAHLVYEVYIAEPDETRNLLADLGFPLRSVVIVHPNVQDMVDDVQSGTGSTQVTTFSPEYIEVQAASDTTAILTLALPYTTGWHAEIDGESVEVLKAYDGLSAVVMPSGSHTITLQYLPLSFLVGAGTSILTLIGIVIGMAGLFWRERKA